MKVARRSPETVMRLSRLGALHQSRLSFMRVLLRRMAAEAWTVTRAAFEIGADGVGHGVYRVDTGARVYSLVAFAHDLPDEKRSDRVIAEAWDTTFALFDGDPDADDIARLSQNVPVQEVGRVSERELTLSRANRSGRLWTMVVEALAAGRQPKAAEVAEVGYLMRTTAVYGSGKFGAADRAVIADRPEMQVPFQAEMLTVYLIRTFVRDLVEHMAVAKGGSAAARLDPKIAQSLGIGNSTGLGMAPFLVNHPVLFNNWIMAREEAIARVRGLEAASQDEVAVYQKALMGMVRIAATWQTDHPGQSFRISELLADLAQLSDEQVHGSYPWDRLMRWAATELSEEGQECLASMILEPYGALVDGLAARMADPVGATVRLDGSMPVSVVRGLIERCFGWALGVDWDDPKAVARAWYVSAEKLEPRLGERFAEPIAPYEQPLAPARDAARAHEMLAEFGVETPVAEALLAYPEHRGAVRRAQLSQIAPYGEIRDNTIAADMMPIDMLRAKLSFFGATRFDPRSDRWVRICMFAGAPYPEDLTPGTADFWVYG